MRFSTKLDKTPQMTSDIQKMTSVIHVTFIWGCFVFYLEKDTWLYLIKVVNGTTTIQFSLPVHSNDKTKFEFPSNQSFSDLMSSTPWNSPFGLHGKNILYMTRMSIAIHLFLVQNRQDFCQTYQSMHTLFLSSIWKKIGYSYVQFSLLF